jgi:thiamine biosynthesis lipoprotein
VNASASSIVTVSTDFARALRLALRAARLTDGLVDPTIGEAVLRAGYTADLASLEPDDAPVEPAPAAGWRTVRLHGQVVHRPPGLVLDLNGVVKGLTVDDALELCEGPGFVSAGGDLAVRGETVVSLPGGGTVTVERGGLATSGTRRRWLRAGAEQHHLIDPAKGLPSRSPWLEVTVSAASCVEADVAAKAAFLAGHDGPGWLDGHGLAGRFLGDVVVESAHWRGAVGQHACT